MQIDAMNRAGKMAQSEPPTNLFDKIIDFGKEIYEIGE